MQNRRKKYNSIWIIHVFFLKKHFARNNSRFFFLVLDKYKEIQDGTYFIADGNNLSKINLSKIHFVLADLANDNT
jgi:hypothetical protein